MQPVGVFFCHDIRLFKYLKSNKDWLISLSIDLTRIIQKRTKETSRSPLFTGFTARFARAYARRNNVLFTPALLERERERVYKYLELPNYLLSFSRLFFSPYSMIQTQIHNKQHLYYIRRCSLWLEYLMLESSLFFLFGCKSNKRY